MADKKQYHGGIWCYGNQNLTLSLGCGLVSDVLEEYGHQVDRFDARDDGMVTLVSDHFRVRLRLHPPRFSRYAAVPLDSRDKLHRMTVVIIPDFAGHGDGEISELLMAMMLRRLAESLNVRQVEWMAAETRLEAAKFLSVFRAEDTTNDLPPEAAPRKSANAFAPVEETARSLEQHCAALDGRALATAQPPLHRPLYASARSWVRRATSPQVTEVA